MLEALEISPATIRQRVEEIIGAERQEPRRSGHIPFTPRAKKTLEISLREALQLGHKYIGTEHILLGLIREGDSVAARVLVALGADLNRVRPQVVVLLRAYEYGESGERASSPAIRGTRRRCQHGPRRRLVSGEREPPGPFAIAVFGAGNAETPPGERLAPAGYRRD